MKSIILIVLLLLSFRFANGYEEPPIPVNITNTTEKSNGFEKNFFVENWNYVLAAVIVVIFIIAVCLWKWY